MKKQLFLATIILMAIGHCVSQDSSKKSVTQQNDSNTATTDIQKQKKDKSKPIESIHDKLKKAADSKEAFWYLLLLAFLAGVFVSFTPCVYPMIPITMGVLQSETSQSFFHSIISVICYIFGISVVYSFLGYFSAKAGILFGQWMSNPWLIGFIILFFLYLAFSMFGLYDLYIPKFFRRRSEVKVRGSWLKIFLFGMLSGTVASPCLTPALAALLAIVAKQGNPVVGFLMMFFFSLGMGVLIAVIGVFSTVLNILPKSGEWMVEINRIMGFVLLAVCIYFLQPFIGYKFSLLSYGMILLVAGQYFFRQRHTKGTLSIIIGLLLITGTIAVIWLYIRDFILISIN